MTLVEALIRSEYVETVEEAQEVISEMRERMFNGEDPDDLLYEVGLEPDYVMDLLNM